MTWLTLETEGQKELQINFDVVSGFFKDDYEVKEMIKSGFFGCKPKFEVKEIRYLIVICVDGSRACCRFKTKELRDDYYEKLRRIVDVREV